MRPVEGKSLDALSAPSPATTDMSINTDQAAQTNLSNRKGLPWEDALSRVLKYVDPVNPAQMCRHVQEAEVRREGNFLRMDFSRDPQIFLEIEGGVWRLVCVFDPEKAKQRGNSPTA